MDMNTIIRVVEGHADKLAERWLQRLRKEEGTMYTYLREPEEHLLQHVQKAYEQIGVYLDQPRHHVIAEHFRETGRRRRHEGVPLPDVVRAIQIARIVLWQYVLEQGVVDSSVNLYQGINLFKQVNAVFDSAVLFSIEGYLEEEK